MDPERDEPTVNAALRALARQDRVRMASAPHVQTTLRAHVRARAAARSARRRIALAAAAGVAGLALVLTYRSPALAPSTSTDTSFVALADVATDFLPLPHGSVPMTDGQLIRIEVPRTALSGFGLAPESPELAGTAVLADVLVGEDGVARAVRFVRAAGD